MVAISSRTDGRTRESRRAKEYNRIMSYPRFGGRREDALEPFAIGSRVMLPGGTTARITHCLPSVLAVDVYYYYVDVDSCMKAHRHDELQSLEVVPVVRKKQAPLPFDRTIEDWIPPTFRMLDSPVLERAA